MNTSTTTFRANNTLAFMEDGFELYMNEQCIFLMKDGFIHMAFQFASNHDDRSWLFSLWNDTPEEPVKVPSGLQESLLHVSLEEIGLICASRIDEYYMQHREALYIKKVNERLQAMMSDDNHDIFMEMYHQIKHLDKDGLLWWELTRHLPITVMLSPEYADVLLFGSKSQKKYLMRKMFSTRAYQVLNVEKRGRRYIDALAANLLRCYSVD